MLEEEKMTIHKQSLCSIIALSLITIWFSLSIKAADHEAYRITPKSGWKQTILKDPDCLKQIDRTAICDTIAKTFKDDYPPEAWTEDNCRKTVVAHFLRMAINSLQTTNQILEFQQRYRAYLSVPQVLGSLYLTSMKLTDYPQFHTMDLIRSENPNHPKVKDVGYLFLDLFTNPEFWILWIAKGNDEAILQMMEPHEILKAHYKILETSISFSHIDEDRINQHIVGTYQTTIKSKERFIAVKAFNKTIKKVQFNKQISETINALYKGNKQYEEGHGRAIEFCNIYKKAQQSRHEKALEREESYAVATKFEGLHTGGHWYISNPQEAKAFIESLIEKENSWAIRYYLMLASQYKLEPEQMKDLNEILVAKGDDHGISNKFFGLCESTTGYTKNLSEAKDFIEGLVDRRNPEAIRIKYYGLLQYGSLKRNEAYQIQS